MAGTRRPAAFWVIVVILVLSAIMLLLGQTMGVFDYDFAVRLKLQESVKEVTEYGVAVNRSFGVGDTVIYLPLIIVSIVGLLLKRRWSLVTTAGVLAISAYWATVCAVMLVFLGGVPGYTLQPGLEYPLVTGAYIVFGIWGILYVILRGEKLIA